MFEKQLTNTEISEILNENANETYLIESLILLISHGVERGSVQVSHNGALQFHCPRLFKTYYKINACLEKIDFASSKLRKKLIELYY